MSRRARRRQEEAVHLDVVPMIDCIFFLLVFFMISTRVFTPFGFDVNLPETSTSTGSTGATQAFIVQVRADGAAVVNGKIVAAVEQLRLPEDVEKAVIRADRAASHGDVMLWMDRLQAAGVRAVTLASVPVENNAAP